MTLGILTRVVLSSEVGSMHKCDEPSCVHTCDEYTGWVGKPHVRRCSLRQAVDVHAMFCVWTSCTLAYNKSNHYGLTHHTSWRGANPEPSPATCLLQITLFLR
jgi:hypothetical protein